MPHLHTPCALLCADCSMAFSVLAYSVTGALTTVLPPDSRAQNTAGQNATVPLKTICVVPSDVVDTICPRPASVTLTRVGLMIKTLPSV